MVIDLDITHSFSVYSASSPVLFFLVLTTRSGLQRCVGTAKIDHAAFRVMSSSSNSEADDEAYSILFFPSNLNDACANNPVASTMVSCSHVPPVAVQCVLDS